MFVTRIASMVVALFALHIAWAGNATIYGLVHYAWTGLGSAFGPLVIAALYNKNCTRHAALAGLIIGGTTAALWPWTNIAISPIIPGFTFAIIALYAISYITKKYNNLPAPSPSRQ